MSHRDGVENITIYWDDNDGEYYAGQLLTGRIEVIVAKTTHFRGIRLKITGTMKIKWIEIDGGSTIPYEEFENILYENLDIFTPNLKKKDDLWIFPGKHVYKFAYKLPEDLPYSLDSSRYGRIEYKSKAELLIPGGNPVESLEEEFYINSHDSPAVLARQSALEGQLPRENVEYGVLGGGCFVKKSHVELFVKLERSVYKQGQVIRPIVECTVEEGNCEVDAVMIVLVQETIFTCNLDESDEMRKKEVLVMGEDTSEEDADGGEREIYNNLKMKIDKNMPPTGFPHCDFIDCGYFVHAVAKTNRLYDDVVVKLPIIIQHGGPEDWEEDEDIIDNTINPEEKIEEKTDINILNEKADDDYDTFDDVHNVQELTNDKEDLLPGQIEIEM